MSTPPDSQPTGGQPTPIAVPDELKALADHHPVVITALRDAREGIEQAVDLDERTIELVRIGALVALGAPAAALRSHVRRAVDAGATTADVWDAVGVLATIVGVPRLLAAVPEIADTLAQES